MAASPEATGEEGTVTCIELVLRPKREANQDLERTVILKSPKTTTAIRMINPTIATMFKKSFLRCSSVVASSMPGIVPHVRFLSTPHTKLAVASYESSHYG